MWLIFIDRKLSLFLLGANEDDLAALVPNPRVNLTRFHGVFVRGGPPPNSRHRVTITPAKRNKAKQALPTGQERGAKT